MDQTQTNQILTCIVDGIRADRSNAIRLAAAKALLNSLDFCSSNFEQQAERDMLMRVVCEATQVSLPDR
jgi:importin subunit beta-1